MSTRDEFVKKLHVKLEEWNADIDKLSAKASEVKVELRQDYAEQLEALKAKQAVARQKLEELQKSGGSAWEDLKAGIELAWAAVGEALDSVKSRFK
ncbi:coiled coil domain-containing protein [Geobacter grbiciae]|uniref:coiled coil domain-containing protein n=1 Tax=Geobacter grbiciae TaxID=155042 RepID=UPI001C025928|nr:coiled coil domain-containing protein [Geobacter grbiciae]MBT1074009.1 coiled coil domain-containing protein [Geobacter grbiciae]